MSRTIACTHCGVVLNLPPEAGGRRLKCPKCGEKFIAGESGPVADVAAPGSKGPKADSTFELTRNARSSLEVAALSVSKNGSVIGQAVGSNGTAGGRGASRPGPGRDGSGGDLPALPTAGGDLRETFDLPMMTGEDPTAGNGRGSAGGADLLFDDRPAAPKRKTGAEARAAARICAACGGFVPKGTSLCQNCGLDQDTGARVDLDDDLAPPPAPRSKPIPIASGVVGGLCLAGSAVAAVLALVQSRSGMDGAIYFVPVALFGAYASAQFLRGKTAKLLLAALALGAAIDVVGLIALPIYQANAETAVSQRSIDEVDNDPDAELQAIQSVKDRLDTRRITTGLVLLFGYAIVSIYLLTPQAQRHVRR